MDKSKTRRAWADEATEKANIRLRWTQEALRKSK